jgi:predicted nucleic acid-binding protein
MDRFSLVLEGRGCRSPAAVGAAGVRRVVERSGVSIVELERGAAPFADAVLDAIREVERPGGVRVVRVEPDELVTASAIARRLGRSRQSIAQLVAGERGPAGFPVPAVWIDGKSRLWRWTDVAEWFAVAGRGSVVIDRVAAEFLAMLNGELQARRHRERLALLAAPELDPDSERFEVETAFPQLGPGRRWRGAMAELGGAARRERA